jgi:single stranded DNA-binding protein
MSEAKEIASDGEGADNPRSPRSSDGSSNGSGKPRARPAERRRLVDERRSLTHHFSVGGQEGYVTVGLYEDGLPGELFIRIAKQGSTVSGLMDSFATAVSLALQYGVPLQILCEKFSHTRFEPSGWSENPKIGYAKSLMDYLFRWLELRFLKGEQGVLIDREGQNQASDPEVKYTPSGVVVAKLSLATNERFKDKNDQWQDRTEWHNIVAWQRLAEIVGEYVRKGTQLYIEGKLQTTSWQDRQSGEKKYRTEIVARDIILLGSRENGEKGAVETPNENSGPKPVSSVVDEDIPF